FGKRLLEKVKGRKAEPFLQSVLRDVLLEDRPNDGEVGANPAQVLVRLCEYDRQPALRRADIDERLVLRPGEVLSQGVGDTQAEAGHGGKELLETLGITVERIEEVPSMLGFVLWSSGFEAFREIAPEAEQASTHHLEHAADVSGLGAVEIKIG